MTVLALLVLLVLLPAAALAQHEPSVDETAGAAAVEAAKEAEEVDEEDTESAAEAEENPRLVRIYLDGCVYNFEADEEWEFYEVERADIRQGNADLMREVSARGSEGGLMLGATAYSGEDDPQLGVYGRTLDGPVGQGEWKRRIGRNGDWQELYFDFADEDSYNAAYDRSTLRGNWELDHFTRNGYVWAPRSNDDAVPTGHAWEAAARDRGQTDASYRSGSAEGGSWRLNLRRYDLELPDSAPPQPDDSRLTRVEIEGRIVDCDTAIDAAAFAGSYRSRRAQLDNDFAGAHFDAGHWLGDRLELQADGSLTRIEADLQDADATRSDFSAQLGWDMSCDLRLSTFARGYSEDSGVSAGSRIRGLQERGARLDYRPAGGTALSASLARREIEIERLQLESADLLPFYFQFDPLPTREDLAGVRVAEQSSGTLLDLAARHRFSRDFYAGASYRSQQFSKLPPAARILTEPGDPYFADSRAQSSLHAAWDLCDLGNVTFRADRDERSNGARGSIFSRNQYTLGYSAPLCRATRLGLGVTRQATSINTTVPENDFAGTGWNYSVNLSGYSGCTNYVVSASRATSEAHAGGNLDALGLELDFDSHWRLSAWWRQFDDFLGGRSAKDAGVQVGYRIEL